MCIRDSLRLFTSDITKTRKTIQRVMKKNNMDFKSIKEIIPDLEDSFIEIISGEKAQ